MHRLLIAVVSLAAAPRSRPTGFSSSSTQAQLLCGMWNLSRPGTKPVYLALAGGFLSVLPTRIEEASPTRRPFSK